VASQLPRERITVRRTAPVPAPTPAPAARGNFSPGDSVTLSRPGGAGNTVVARDEDSYAALVGARSVGEFTALREAGRIRTISDGTLAVVIESRPGRTRVRIADGPQLGFEGWVAEEYTHPWK
jgi:hypothetical protein